MLKHSRRRYTASRRTALGGLAFAAVATHWRTASTAATQDDATPIAGSWTFTDDAGMTATLDAPPQRIAADLTATATLRDFGVVPDATAGGPWNLNNDAAWGSVDRDTQVLSSNPESGAPDMEKLVEFDPDLFITLYWGNPDDPYAWSFAGVPEIYVVVNERSPVIAISAVGNAGANVERFAELAEHLGADPNAPDVAKARQEFEGAKTALREIAIEKPEIKVMFIHADREGAVIANPAAWGELNFYKSLGVNIVDPAVPDAEYWEDLSLEQVGKYPFDLLMQSTRTGLLRLKEFADQPTWLLLPAIQAGQFAGWETDVIQSYQGLTRSLETLTAALSEAEKVTE